MKNPKYTLLYSIKTSCGYSSRVREFYDDEKKARTMYDMYVTRDKYPTLRPFHKTDLIFLEY